MARTTTIPQRSKALRTMRCVPNDNAGKRFHKEKLRDASDLVRRRDLRSRDQTDYAESKYWRRGREHDLATRGWDTDYDACFSDEELETTQERRERRAREREAFEELRRLLDDEPCTCIGPCLYPQGMKHPTAAQKRQFALALDKPAKLGIIRRKHVVLPKHLQDPSCNPR